MSDRHLRAGLIRLAHTHPEFRKELLPLLASEKEAGQDEPSYWYGLDPKKPSITDPAPLPKTSAWDNLPPGWTQDSVESFWDSLTGDVKHKVTKCMEQMQGKVDDPGAFCGSLGSAVGYRSASLLRSAAIRVAHADPTTRPHLLPMLSKRG